MNAPRPSVTRCAALLLAALALPVQGASFDCAQASTLVERFICGDSDLGALDERMAHAYRRARNAAVAPAAGERLVAEQRVWLSERDACETSACVARLYEARLAALTEGTGAPAPLPLIRLQETGPHYRIVATFPVLTERSDADVVANQEIRSLVEAIIVPVRGELAEAAREAERGGSGWQGTDWSLLIDYGPTHRTERFLAIPFSGYVYTGGAHGMPVLENLVIETTTGRRIPPEGLFAPGADWLETLSSRCLSELKRRDLLGDDDEWLRKGTAPQPENYQLLFPRADGLKVTFAPYSVAPYAAGILEVVIPYPDLDGLLDPRLFGP